MAGIVTLMDAVLDGAVGVLSRRPLGVPWRPQALQKPSCQDARGTFLSGGQSECEGEGLQVSTPEAPALSGRASDPSRGRGRA